VEVELGSEKDELLLQTVGGVAVLTMNRPERRNALTPTMLEAMGGALSDIERDPAVTCVVLTGAGEAFCSGGDVSRMADKVGRSPVFDDAHVDQQRRYQRQTAGRLFEMSKPTIAMLPGPAAGAGLSLALACDLRYAADTAVLTTAFARVALSGDFGGSWLLTQLVGTARARELFYLSPRIGAAEALRMGLLNAVFPADRLRDEVMTVAAQLARGPAIALKYMKANLNRALGSGFMDCLDAEAFGQARTRATADNQEAATAFLEKRQPTFQGR
jgi:2-(1,2-epoxy-1,2-dihydrophenyl)acetyl-CoA isomerase